MSDDEVQIKKKTKEKPRVNKKTTIVLSVSTPLSDAVRRQWVSLILKVGTGCVFVCARLVSLVWKDSQDIFLRGATSGSTISQRPYVI